MVLNISFQKIKRARFFFYKIMYINLIYQTIIVQIFIFSRNLLLRLYKIYCNFANCIHRSRRKKKLLQPEFAIASKFQQRILNDFACIIFCLLLENFSNNKLFKTSIYLYKLLLKFSLMSLI